ncbi:MAG: DPP IV N-terminal domain-containing protein [Flavobacteriales bacterium]|nr:DPP IV N-terminal domain-containing protein [Flavobacteriales bacterium]
MKTLKNIVFLLCVILSMGVSAQKSKITLQDAVLSAQKFSPEKQLNISWAPTGARWAYFDTSKRNIVLETISGGKTVITQADLEKAFSENIPYVSSSFAWKDADNMYIYLPKGVYRYSVSTKKGEKLLSTDVICTYKQIAPSATAWAYSKDGDLYFQANGKTTVRVTTDGVTDGIVNGETVHRNEFGISGGIFFSPKSNKIAFYRKDERSVAQYPLVNTSTRIATVKNIRYPMAGEKSEEVTLHIYDIATAKTVEIKKQGAAEDYLTAVTWDPSEKYIYVAELTRDQKHMCFNKFDAATGAFVKTLFTEDSDKWVEPEEAAIFFPSRPNEMFWRSERDGNVHYYRYSTSGTLLGRATDGAVQVERVIGLVGDMFYYVATADNGLDRTIKFTDLKTSKVGFVHGEKGTWNGFVDPLGKYMVCTYTALETPFKVELTALTKDGRNMGKTVRSVFESKNPLQNYTVGNVKIGRIIKNGLEYNTYTVFPSNFDPTRRYPVLLYVYGGPHMQMVKNVFQGGAQMWMHVMAERGYVVFVMDGRGTPARGFDWESAIHRQCGKLEMADQMVGIDFLKNQSYIYPERIAVYGWSYGGFMASTLMFENPDVFNVAVAGGPVVDWKWYEVMYTERYMDTPQDNAQGFADASLLSKIKNLKKPMLVIHGTADPVVVWQQSQELLRESVNNGIQLDYMIYPGHEHNVMGVDRLHLITKILDYIEKNNQ